MIDNALLISNGKGGTCKTSLTANIAALAALTGWKVLAVDLDPQGNLGRDLGYLDRCDDGQSLADAVQRGTTPVPLTNVRPNLDVLAGGPALDGMLGALQSAAVMGKPVMDTLEKVLKPLSADYDLVVIDTPPGEQLLQRAAYVAAHWLVIPTAVDAASRDGISRVADRVVEVTNFNSGLSLLGIALVLLPSRAHVLSAEARAAVNELFGDDVVFRAEIRQATKAAMQCRERGVVAAEYEDAAAAASSAERYAAGTPWSSAAEGLSSDYQALVTEILDRISQEAEAA